MYFLAIVCPPLAVLMVGKPIQAVLNFFLTLCLWVPGMIHAFAVVGEYKADRRAMRTAAYLGRRHRYDDD